MRFPLKPRRVGSFGGNRDEMERVSVFAYRGCSDNAASRSLKINSSGKDTECIRLTVSKRCRISGCSRMERKGRCRSRCRASPNPCRREAFGQEEVGGIFIEQDGVALLHFGETGRHGAVLDEYGKIFERVCIFCGNDGVGTPNKAFPFVETESGELSRLCSNGRIRDG